MSWQKLTFWFEYKFSIAHQLEVMKFEPLDRPDLVLRNFFSTLFWVEKLGINSCELWENRSCTLACWELSQGFSNKWPISFDKTVLKWFDSFNTNMCESQLLDETRHDDLLRLLQPDIDPCQLPYTRLRANAQGPVDSNSGRHLVVLHPHHHFLIHGQFGRLPHCGEDGISHRLCRRPSEAD